MANFQQRVLSGQDIEVTSYTDATTGTVNALSVSAISDVHQTGLTLLQGLSGGVADQIVYYHNDSGSTQTIVNEASGATAANRITTGTGANLLVQASAGVIFQYDASSSRYHIIGTGAPTAQVAADPTNGSYFAVGQYPATAGSSAGSGTASSTTINEDSAEFTIRLGTERTSIRCYADYASANITALSDNSNLFNTADGGTGIWIHKTANSRVINFKNNTGASDVISIIFDDVSISSTTAWA
jgi:hypothetical protein